VLDSRAGSSISLLRSKAVKFYFLYFFLTFSSGVEIKRFFIVIPYSRVSGDVDEMTLEMYFGGGGKLIFSEIVNVDGILYK
jgi:hypothetical protein